MPGIHAELQDVPLPDAHVFQQLPGRVRGAFRLASAKLAWKILKSAGHVRVRFTLGEEINNVLPKRGLIVHLASPDTIVRVPGCCAPISLRSRLPEGPRLASDSLDADTPPRLRPRNRRVFHRNSN